MALSGKERKYCEEYVRTGSKHEAFNLAGYAKCKNTTQVASKVAAIHARPQVLLYIQELEGKRNARVGITHDMVLRRLWAIASADPNEIVSVKVSNCRYCWGTDFRYNYTLPEWEDKLAEAETHNLAEPLEEGGHTFTINRPPHPDCPRCGGAGKAKLMIQDTTQLTGSARILYAGAEPTRNGIKVKLHNQLDALVKIADAVGLFESATVERIRVAQAKKLEVETDQIGKDVIPVKVEIKVVDASNPNRVIDDEPPSDA